MKYGIITIKTGESVNASSVQTLTEHGIESENIAIFNRIGRGTAKRVAEVVNSLNGGDSLVVATADNIAGTTLNFSRVVESVIEKNASLIVLDPHCVFSAENPDSMDALRVSLSLSALRESPKTQALRRSMGRKNGRPKKPLASNE